MKVKFMPSKDSDEAHLTHCKSDNVEIITGLNTDIIIEELFHSLLHRHQVDLEQ